MGGALTMVYQTGAWELLRSLSHQSILKVWELLIKRYKLKSVILLKTFVAYNASFLNVESNYRSQSKGELLGTG